jgi:hypothetical protein
MLGEHVPQKMRQADGAVLAREVLVAPKMTDKVLVDVDGAADRDGQIVGHPTDRLSP